jgi:hypothetical protein
MKIGNSVFRKNAHTVQNCFINNCGEYNDFK